VLCYQTVAEGQSALECSVLRVVCWEYKFHKCLKAQTPHWRFYQGDSLSSCQGLHSWVLSSVWLSCCIGIEFGWHGKRQRWLWFNRTTVTNIIAGVHYFMSATVWWWFRLLRIQQIHLMTVKHASLFNSSCSSLSGYFNELIQLTVFVFTFIRTAVTGIFSQKE